MRQVPKVLTIMKKSSYHQKFVAIYSIQINHTLINSYIQLTVNIKRGEPSMKMHITKQGESIETITNRYAVSKQDLTGINPHVNLSSDLVPGLKLKIPDTHRTEKNEHIENFYPNLEAEQHLKEQAVPIGLKPFESTHALGNDKIRPNQHTHEEISQPIPSTPSTPWGHLDEHTTHLNPETNQQFPWNQQFPSFSPHDTRLLIPPVPYYPPYSPYPYQYPYLGYGYGYGLPIPVFGFGGGYVPGYGHGWHGGFGHGFGGGWHGGGGGHHR